jgi:hypothetical protein
MRPRENSAEWRTAYRLLSAAIPGELDPLAAGYYDRWEGSEFRGLGRTPALEQPASLEPLPAGWARTGRTPFVSQPAQRAAAGSRAIPPDPTPESD